MSSPGGIVTPAGDVDRHAVLDQAALSSTAPECYHPAIMRRAALCALFVAVAASSTRLGAGQIGGVPPLLGGVRVIEGRVLNPEGDPVPNVFVTVLRPDPLGERPFIPDSVKLFSVTNSQGEFRLDPVTVGKQYLVALPQNLAPGPVSRFNRNGYGRTFYPSSADIAGAEMVSVTPIKPTRVNITILPARLALVSGTIFLASGQPATGGVLRVALGDGFFGLGGRGFSIRPDGQFIVPALAPGTYHLHYPEGPWPPPLGQPVVISTATVTVAGSDVTGVRVAPIVPIRVTGRVTVEPTGSVGPAAAQVLVSGSRVDGNPGPTRPLGTVNDDLTFEFRAWPGANRIRVRLPDAWVVRSIRLNGVDVSKQPVDFQAGKDVTGLDVAIARR